MARRVVGRLAVLPRPPVAAAPDAGARRARERLRRRPDRLVAAAGLDPAPSTRPSPARFREHHARLRGRERALGAVVPPAARRSWSEARGGLKLPEVAGAPRALRAARRPSPRAFWVPWSGRRRDPGPAGRRSVRYEPPIPTPCGLTAATPPGLARRPGWPPPGLDGRGPVRARCRSCAAPGRYRALADPGRRAGVHSPLPPALAARRPSPWRLLGRWPPWRPGPAVRPLCRLSPWPGTARAILRRRVRKATGNRTGAHAGRSLTLSRPKR